MTRNTSGLWDCIIVGAGAAGLSAGLTLGRGRRPTLIIDGGRPSNLVAAGVGGLLGQDRRSPQEFYAAGRAELGAYPDVHVRSGEIVQGAREDDGTFAVQLAGGGAERTRRLILAPGMDYRYPQLPGMEERWGRTVFHCPFCHGWEVRDRPLGVLADGAVGVHGALNLRTWSDRITLLTNGSSALTDQQREQLAAGGVALDERPITALDGPGAELQTVSFSTGDDLAVSAILVKTILWQRSSLALQLDAELIEPDEMLSVQAIKVDAMQRTAVPGLYAAGDAATSVPPSVAAAVASGYLAGASAVVSLATSA